MTRSLGLAYNEVQFTRLFFKSILIYTFQQLVVWAKEISSKEQKKLTCSLVMNPSLSIANILARRRERQPYRKIEDTLRLAWVVRSISQGFWSHSGCLLRNAIILVVKVSLRVKQRHKSKNALISVSLQDFRWSRESSLLALAPFLNSDW